MAGRPKMMAKKVTELAAKAEEVFNLLDEYIPEQYENDAGPLENDPLCKAWLAAVDPVYFAMYRTGELAKLLRAKAGIAEPEPSAAFAAFLANEANRTEQGEGAMACDIPH